MLHTVRAKRTGGAWVSALAGLGFLGLLVTIAIMVYMFSKETDAVFTPGTGTIPAKEQAKKLMENINVRNADVDRRIAQEASQGAVATPVAARIKAVEWQRLRCRVTLETPMAGVTVDVRTKANAPDSSLTSTPKETDATGQVSLIIPDDEQAGAAAVVVLLDVIGNVLSKQATTIGER